MEISKQKAELRKYFKSLRDELSEAQVQEKSQQINYNFIHNILPKLHQKNSEKKFSLYFATGNEVTTDLISQHFDQEKIIFSYPKIKEKNQPLEFILKASNQHLAPNKFFPKILEPQSGTIILPDIIILPLLAFDDHLARLGMGGGFFDRTIELLKKQNSKIITVGLAYDYQRAENTLPTEKTDQRLDFIVTEKTIFSAN